MKQRSWTILCLILALCLQTANGAPDARGETNAISQVTIEMRDGCIVAGTFKAKDLSFASDTLGKMQIPVARLEKVVLAQSETVVSFWNQDSIKAKLTEKELPFQTAFGELKIPVAQIVEMRFRRPPAPKEAE